MNRKSSFLLYGVVAAVCAVMLFTGHVDIAGAAGLILAAPPAILEVKSLEEVGKALHAFMEANDERIEKLEKGQRPDVLLEKKVDKANEAVEKALKGIESVETSIKAEKARADALEATLKRLNVQAANGGMEVKAEHIVAYAAMYGVDVNAEQFAEHKQALVRYMRKGDQAKLQDFQSKALSVDSNPDGGYWVMPDTTGRIVQKVFESSPMRQYAAVQGISTDALEGDYDLDEAASGWVSERGTRSETNTPQVGQWRIPVHELYAEPRATQKLLDDSQVDPEAWLAGKVQSKFSRDEATAFVSGTGVGKPRGFLTYATGVPTKGAWKVVEQTGTGASGAFAAAPNGADIFITAMGLLKEHYHPGAIWAMNRTTRAAARKLKDSDGHYVLNMDATNGFKPTIFGIPVVSFEDMPAIAADSLSIALANFAEAYQIVDRIGIRVLRDPFTAKPYVKFYTTKRVGGDVINHEAIKLIKFG